MKKIFKTFIKQVYFFSLPEKYWKLKLPHKLPPKKEPLPVTGLPMLGFLEQEVSTALISSLTACGNFKPKYPFISSSRSALLYVAYHLKGEPQKSMFSFSVIISLVSDLLYNHNLFLFLSLFSYYLVVTSSQSISSFHRHDQLYFMLLII